MKKNTLTLYRLFLCSLTLLFGLQANAQKVTSGSMVSTNFCDTIPFEYVKNKIIIKAVVNNRVGRFILDTGAPFLISSSFLEALQLDAAKKQKVTDVSGKTQDIAMVSIDSLTLGSTKFSNTTALVYDNDSNIYLICSGVDGLIGSVIFKHTVLHIDVEKKIIVLSHENDLARSGDNAIKLKQDATGRPFINVNVGGKHPVHALFDSGSNKFCTLAVKTLTKLAQKNGAHILHTGHGAASAGLFGNSDQGAEYRVSIPTFSLGSFSLTDVVTTASEHKKTDAVGMSLAEYGSVTIDYLKKRFYFKPYQTTAQFKPPIFFGFSILLNDGKPVISVVYDNSPADQAGLKIGQELVQVDELDLTNLPDICSVYLDPLFNKDKTTITVRNADGKTETVHLTAQ